MGGVIGGNASNQNMRDWTAIANVGLGLGNLNDRKRRTDLFEEGQDNKRDAAIQADQSRQQEAQLFQYFTKQENPDFNTLPDFAQWMSPNSIAKARVSGVGFKKSQLANSKESVAVRKSNAETTSSEMKSGILTAEMYADRGQIDAAAKLYSDTVNKLPGGFVHEYKNGKMTMTGPDGTVKDYGDVDIKKLITQTRKSGAMDTDRIFKGMESMQQEAFKSNMESHINPVSMHDKDLGDIYMTTETDIKSGKVAYKYYSAHPGADDSTEVFPKNPKTMDERKGKADLSGKKLDNEKKEAGATGDNKTDKWKEVKNIADQIDKFLMPFAGGEKGSGFEFNQKTGMMKTSSAGVKRFTAAQDALDKYKETPPATSKERRERDQAEQAMALYETYTAKVNGLTGGGANNSDPLGIR